MMRQLIQFSLPMIVAMVVLGTVTIMHSVTAFVHPSSPSKSAFNRFQSQTRKQTVTHHHRIKFQLHQSKAKDQETLQQISDRCNEALRQAEPEFVKTCKVQVAPTSSSRLGLFATENIRKGDVALAIPYDDQITFTPDLTLKTVYNGIIPDEYDGWTGDNGLIALLLLNELAKAGGSGGIPLPTRKVEAQTLVSAWVQALPSPSEMSTLHPLLWDEDDQEILQSSSTKKIYRLLDDIEDDANWLLERVWEEDRVKFPEKVVLGDGGEEYDCFSVEGFTWAIAIVSSRSVFVDGQLRLIPFLDMANHDDIGVEEIQGGTMGRFGTTKGATLRTASNRKYDKGEEVYVTYGPKSAAEYLLEHGFIPRALRPKFSTTSVAELTFEIDPDDRFYDDKLDILEFETYESAPMEPSQSFDVVSEVGRDGEPDPALIQFLRLVKLGDMDAFLLESIFRNEVWGFMSLPVSEKNERGAMDVIAAACTKALKDMDSDGDDTDGDGATSTTSASSNDGEEDLTHVGLCAMVRSAEQKALTRTLEYVNREKEALDLKEYYQERRLKDLGLDSEWSPDDASSFNPDEDLGYGQSRAPGSLDW